MAKQATLLLMLIILLMAFGASAILPTVDAHYGGHSSGFARSTAGSRFPMDAAEKASWPEAAKSSEPSLLATSSVSAFVVLVTLLAAALICRGRKEPT